MQVDDAGVIPRQLLEQVKGLPFPPENFYRYFSYFRSPLTFLYALADVKAEQPVQGMLWFSVNPMTHVMSVHLVSLDKEYQGKWFVKKRLIPFLTDAMRKIGVNTAIWQTDRPKAWQRFGYAAVRTVIKGTI